VPRKAKSQSRDSQWNQRSKLIEEYATLDQEVSNFKPTLFRHQKLRELILGWYPGLEPEEEALVPGVNIDIVISARDNMRRVTAQGKQKLYKLWGAQRFVANSNILLKTLPDPEDKLGLYTVQALTGPRHLRVIAKSRTSAGGSSPLPSAAA
jgi:hypothetical protein